MRSGRHRITRWHGDPSVQVSYRRRAGGDLTPGSFPTANTWWWTLIDRPAGSHAWIEASSQPTSAADVVFLPVLPGQYTVQAAALTITLNNNSQLAWTTPAAVTVTVLSTDRRIFHTKRLRSDLLHFGLGRRASASGP